MDIKRGTGGITIEKLTLAGFSCNTWFLTEDSRVTNESVRKICMRYPCYKEGCSIHIDKINGNKLYGVHIDCILVGNIDM
jgi:hypothetical protein